MHATDRRRQLGLRRRRGRDSCGRRTTGDGGGGSNSGRREKCACCDDGARSLEQRHLVRKRFLWFMLDGMVGDVIFYSGFIGRLNFHLSAS